MWKRNFTRSLVSCCIAIVSISANGDAFIMTKAMSASTIAEIFIQDNEVRVELEIGLNDIQAFKNLLPDEVYQKLTDDHEPYQARINTFFQQDFTISANDKRLLGKVIRIGPRDRIKRDLITGDAITVLPQQSNKVIFAQLVYPFTGKPKTITIKPPLKNGRAAAEIGFMTYHQGLHINDFRYLSRAESLTLQWDDPWYSSFNHKNLARRYNQPLSAFLYIEPFEVRKEIIIRPLDIQKYT